MTATATATATAPALVTNADPRARVHYSDAPGTTRCGISAPVAVDEAASRKVCFLCQSAPAPAAPAAPAAPVKTDPASPVTVRIASGLVPVVMKRLPALAADIAAAPVKGCGTGSMVHLTATRREVEAYRDFLGRIVAAKDYGQGTEKWRVTRALRVANTDLDKAAS